MLRRFFNPRNIIITLDGPAASGKSTTARLVAQRLGWLYLDTGAMYRGLAVKAVRKGIPLTDPVSIGAMAKQTKMHMLQDDSAGMQIFVDEEDVTDQIRTPEIDKAVGPVCEVPEVRDEMVRLQRAMAKCGHLVTEGRDMGTVVFPNADLKFYIIASIDARAKRRQIDMKQRGIRLSLDALQKDIQQRDERDSQREHSPLCPADDARQINTSEMTIDEQVNEVLQQVDRLLHRLPRYRKVENPFYRISAILLPRILKMFFGFKIQGTENFPMTGGVLVAPNHVSMLDPPVVGSACPREIYFFAKQELFQTPLLGNIIRRLNAFPVRREAGDRSAIRAAFFVLQKKRPLLLFPEGTRSKNGQLQSAKSGIGMIALRNKVDILPVAVQGTYKVWRHFFQRRIRIHFGKPIPIASFLESPLSKKQIYQDIGELTIKRIKELQDDCDY
ncbi:(d)CMP kinase [bacterium]|nr:(d)CMP kinase [bacterium]